MVFTRGDIERSFTKTILDRGHRYFKQGKVIDVWLDHRQYLRAKVEGSGWEPYHVRIVPTQRAGWVELESDCTCPYEEQCKHGAAVAYEVLERGYRQQREDDLVFADLDDDEDEEEEEEEVEREFVLPAPAPPVKLDIPIPTDLVEWLRKVEGSLADEHALAPDMKQRLFYRLKLKPNAWGGYGLIVALVNRKLLKSGGFGAMTDVRQSTVTNWQKPQHWSRFDAALIADLHANLTAPDYNAAYLLDGRHGERLLREVLASGSAIWEDGGSITLGPVRHGTFEWDEKAKKGMYTPRIRVEERGVVLMMTRPWYVDVSERVCGPIECGIEPELAGVLIRRAPIPPDHLAGVRSELERMKVPEAALPTGGDRIVVRAPDLVPCLSVDFELCRMSPEAWNPPLLTAPVAFAKLTFEYDGVRAPADGDDVKLKIDDEFHVLKRNVVAEERAREALLHWGWVSTTYSGWEIPSGRGKQLCIVPNHGNRLTQPLEKVHRFAETVVPKLLEAGWKVDLDVQFRYVPETEVEWDVEVEDGSGLDWFQFKLGIRVEGEPFDLRPILAQALRPLPDYAKTEDVFVFGLNGRAIKLSRSRLEALLQPLVELFGGVAEWPEDLRLSKAALPELERLQEKAADAKVV